MVNEQETITLGAAILVSTRLTYRQKSGMPAGWNPPLENHRLKDTYRLLFTKGIFGVNPFRHGFWD